MCVAHVCKAAAMTMPVSEDIFFSNTNFQAEKDMQFGLNNVQFI